MQLCAQDPNTREYPQIPTNTPRIPPKHAANTLFNTLSRGEVCEGWALFIFVPIAAASGSRWTVLCAPSAA